jgi:signal transduction histidine kinase
LKRKGLDVVASRGSGRDNNTIDLGGFNIGDVQFEFHIFDLDPQMLALGVTDKRGLREFLEQNGGIRVYRDGVRVYDYGEPGNDWLNLGGRRVNFPTRRLSNNIVIGALSLSLNDSRDLVEKTNREGFVENDAFAEFRDAAACAVQQVTVERNVDKTRIRAAYQRPTQPLTDAIEDLRDSLEKRGLIAELGPYIDTIERDFRAIRDRLLTAAGAGLSLAVVIHEVEKGVAELNKAVERDVSLPRVRELAKHLSELITGLTYLTRRSGQTKENGSTLVRHALFNTEYRLSYHHIEVTNGFEEGRDDFVVRCTRRLLIATLMNLIDNAIYWLDVKGGADKRLYIGPTRELRGGPAIVVADSGPGFIDPPETVIEPFMSRKPDGMGLGLHLASEVMKVHGGRIEFPEPGDVDLPKEFSGAVVALVFKEQP